jgi:hypothetical protein
VLIGAHRCSSIDRGFAQASLLVGAFLFIGAKSVHRRSSARSGQMLTW